MNPKLLRMYSNILTEQAATQQVPSQSQIGAGFTKQSQLVQQRTAQKPKPASTSQNIKAAGAAFQSQQPAQTAPGGGPTNQSQLANKLGQTAPAPADTQPQPAATPGSAQAGIAFNQAAGSSPGTAAAPAASGGGFKGGGYGSVGAGNQTQLPTADTAAADTATKPSGVFANPTMGAGSSTQTPATTTAAPEKTYGGGYDPTKVQYAVDQPKVTNQIGTGTSGVGLVDASGKAVTSGADLKRGPMGTILPEEELEEDLEKDLEEAFNDMLRLSGIQLNEKAVSKQQQKFMGMVHAMQKGKKVKGASPELKKVAKTMGKKDAKDFASTKHKGLPQKVSESVMLEAGSNLEHIVTRFKHETKKFLNGDDLDSDLYEALYDYYADAGEMPYGVAKARDGDPYQWVSDHFENELSHMGHQRQFNETVMPMMDSQLSELARLAGLSESRVDECGDMGMRSQDTLNVSTNMSSDGTKSVNISAQGEKAEELLSMLKLAGMSASDRPSIIIGSNEEMMDEERETEYANTPEEEYQTVASITRQGNDLNREKKQFADKPKLGDNPMAESILDAELDAMLESILLRDDTDGPEIKQDPNTGRVSATFPAPKRRDPASQEIPMEPESPESRVTGPRSMKVPGERTGTEKEMDEGSIEKSGPHDLTGTWSSAPPKKGQPDVPPPVPMDPVYPDNKPSRPAAPTPRSGAKK